MKHIIEKIDLKNPYYLKDAVKDLFSWQELENLLNLRPFVSANRFHPTDDIEYKWPMQSWLSDVNTWPPSILKEVISKSVCYLSDCSRVNKKINNICKTLENKFNCPTDAHIYFSLLTGEGSEGFRKHWDPQHNLIVQIEGQTNFKIWNKKVTEGDRQVEVKEDPILNVTMSSGDIIFIPKYMVHQAIPLSKRLSISFPMSDGATSQDRHWINLNN